MFETHRRGTRPSFEEQLKARPLDASVWMRHFRVVVETNKTRRRRDGDPPAALPVLPGRPNPGGRTCGAAAMRSDQPDARDFV